MAQAENNDHNAAYRGVELPPSFDPRCAFAWTLRSAEIARRECAGAERRPHGSNRGRASAQASLARA